MDAKVDDWVVTPRRGKAVEINALWYNALRLLEALGARGARGRRRPRAPGRAGRRGSGRSFNARFWYADGGYLYDVVDGESGDDPACRPNQLFAISLRASGARPGALGGRPGRGPRAPAHAGGPPLAGAGPPDYKATYDGDLRARDAAYHQGTVWAWLIGPFVDAWLRVHPEDRADARAACDGFAAHLDEACVGSVSEIFDAEAPFTPRGCIAQALERGRGPPRPRPHGRAGRLEPARRTLMTQTVARVFGAVFLLVGLVGLATTPWSMDAGRLLGLFPVNVLHNLVHLGFGAWGLIAAGTLAGATAYCRIAGIAYLVLAVLGLLTPTGFGLVPIGGHDVWLHALIGAVLTARRGFRRWLSGSPRTAVPARAARGGSGTRWRR